MGEVVPIHKVPEYIQDCCDFLNSEWPKNNDIRLQAMKSSCDELPCSLVLLGNGDIRRERLLGHLQLALVMESNDACCIRSVLIRKDQRRMGFGKHLMLAAEDYARGLGFKTCYLATIDQQPFYRSLGYEECQPMYFLATRRPLMSAKLLETMANGINHPLNSENNGSIPPLANKKGKKKYLMTPPPPPPLPPSTQRLRNTKQDSPIYMKKTL